MDPTPLSLSLIHIGRPPPLIHKMWIKVTFLTPPLSEQSYQSGKSGQLWQPGLHIKSWAIMAVIVIWAIRTLVGL